MKEIKDITIGLVQEEQDLVICDFVIYKDKNPEMFKHNGHFDKSKLNQIKMFNIGGEQQLKIH